MSDEKQARRVKNTEATAHRTGTLRAAVKPHKRTPSSAVLQTITDYMSGVQARSLTQTFWGASVDKNAAVLRKNFGLAQDDTPYLFLDATGTGTGKAGMLISESGVRLSDGRGGNVTISWKQLATTTVAYQRGMLVIGQSGVVSTDGKVLAPLLQRLQKTVR